jgi:hypothetical protein
MKRMLLIFIGFFLVFATIFYFVFIDREPTHEIGRVQVKGIPQVYFDLEQENEYDMATAIYYGVSTERNMTISPMRHLIGTHDYITNPDNFAANSVDSIIYLTWGDTSEIYAVYDLRTGNGYPSRMDNWKEGSEVADSLTQLLKQTKPYLNAHWKK